MSVAILLLTTLRKPHDDLRTLQVLALYWSRLSNGKGGHRLSACRREVCVETTFIVDTHGELMAAWRDDAR